LSVFLYGLLSLATVAVVTTLLFGADWGPPPAAAALCVAMVLAVVCLTAFVIAVSRTERQAEGFASLLVFGLALLGGNFIFVSVSPSLIRRLALLTPNGWALRGFTDLATGASAHAVVQPIVAILAFSLVIGGVAAVFSRRAVQG
jgi:ABC-2 type transport system permease protein